MCSQNNHLDAGRLRQEANCLRYLAAFVCLVILGGGCLDDNTSGVGEDVSVPDKPSGPDTVLYGQPAEYRSGGAVSSKEHPLEYRFDFNAAGSHSHDPLLERRLDFDDTDNHDYSGWRTVPVINKVWPDSGLFLVKAQARCMKHPGNASYWSRAKKVRVNLGDLGVPPAPDGPVGLWVLNSRGFDPDEGEYCTEGLVGSVDHPIQYRFDYDAEGGHSYSAWLDTECNTRSWPVPGTYVVKVQARWANDSTVVSPWSDGFTVTVVRCALPVIHFTTHITKIRDGQSITETRPYVPHVFDTVGVARPLSISYHGTSPNGAVIKYQFFPLDYYFNIPGARKWTTDLSDTIQTISLVDKDIGNEFYNGIFRFGAQCEDATGARSIADVTWLNEGVCEVVVNFDPDTRITRVLNTCFAGQAASERWINFEDAEPDTVPLGSWVTLFYDGWDSPFDSLFCEDPVNKCVRFQKSFYRYSARIPGAEAQSYHYPMGGEDNNPLGLSDSTSLNMGSVEYEVSVRSLDEHFRPDGTPDMVELIGNYDPVLDECYLKDHLGHAVGHLDTLSWNWWRPANSDTFNEQTMMFEKVFYFTIDATGHDHPLEPESGVKSWRYTFVDSRGMEVRFARSGSWVSGGQLNALSDTMMVNFTYPQSDPAGDQVFADLPQWLNESYDLTLMGRDTESGQHFQQYMFVDGNKKLINEYSISLLGRWTEERTVHFYLGMDR